MVTRFGGPEVLSVVEVPDPRAEPGEVVVTVSVADTLFLDTQLRRGWGQEHFAVRPPYRPGSGVAGTVTQLGSGVNHGWIEQRVVAPTPAGGGYAEQAVAAADSLVLVPDGLDLLEAAAMLHDGTTAFALLESTGVGPGQWVLVLAASGGLGILLVQLARTVGARVIGAARGAAKLDLARAWGAERVIDYSQTGWQDKVGAATGGGGPRWSLTAWEDSWDGKRSRSSRMVVGFPPTVRPAVGSPPLIPNRHADVASACAVSSKPSSTIKTDGD
jgi:NADPH:quinone reductase